MAKKTKQEKRYERRLRALREARNETHEHDDCPTCAALRSGDSQSVLERMFSTGNVTVGGVWADAVERSMTPEEMRLRGITTAAD
jgi:hypothetical protein